MMKRWVYGCALAALLTAPVLAKDVAIPSKNPAVTLTVPDAWAYEDTDDGLKATSPDKDVVFYLEHGSAGDLEALMRNNREWMKRAKINAAVKPTEREMDFNGTPGRILRYDTKDANGRTLVDFVILNASRNRVVLLTLWGSEDERRDNDADIAAIMKSVRVPADTGGSFWSGGPATGTDARQAGAAGKADAVKPDLAKPEAAKPEAAKPEAGKPQSAPVAPAAVQAAPVLRAQRAQFVARAAANFGDIAPRSDTAFAPGQPLLTYLEPVGQALVPHPEGGYRFGVAVDFDVRTPDGVVIGGRKAMLDKELRTTETVAPQFYLNATVTLSGLEPGAYVLSYLIRDKFSERMSLVEQPFSITAPPAEAAAKP